MEDLFTNPAVLSELFAYLNPVTLLMVVVRVCHAWKNVAEREYVWFRLAHRLKLRGKVDLEREAKWREDGKQYASLDGKYYIPPPAGFAHSWKQLVLRQWCIHLPSLDSCLQLDGAWKAIGAAMDQARCTVCNSMSNTWFCVKCTARACGRNQKGHMLQHWKATHHSVSIETRELFVWCNQCDRYLGEEGCDGERLRTLLMRKALLNDGIFQHRQQRKTIIDECESVLATYLVHPHRFDE